MSVPTVHDSPDARGKAVGVRSHLKGDTPGEANHE